MNSLETKADAVIVLTTFAIVTWNSWQFSDVKQKVHIYLKRIED